MNASELAKRVLEGESPQDFLRHHAPPKHDCLVKKINGRNVVVPISPEAKRNFGSAPLPISSWRKERLDLMGRMTKLGLILKIEGPKEFTCNHCGMETPVNGEGDPVLFVGDTVQCPNCGRNSKLVFPPVAEAEDPKRIFKDVSQRRAAQKEKQRRCKQHGPWETVHNYGAMGYRARCQKCGYQTDFMARDM